MPEKSNIDYLKEAVEGNKAILVLGIGTSIATLGGRPDPNGYVTWKGLLKSGLKSAKNILPKVRHQELDDNIATLERDNVSLRKFLSIGDEVSDAVKDGQFTGWLKETIGGLEEEIKDGSLLHYLHQWNLPILTTNYDNLIEKVTRMGRVTWQKDDAAREILAGKRKDVLHLHGHYDDPETIVLGGISYENFKRSPFINALVQGTILNKSLVFIGMGEGVNDPNFLRFREWMGELFRKLDQRHFFFCLNSEEDGFIANFASDASPIRVIPYGADYSDLLPFLQLHLPAPAGTQPAAAPTPTTPTPKSLPDGFVWHKPLPATGKPATRYKDFLEETYLPYASRKKFKEQTGITNPAFLTEDDFEAALFWPDRKHDNAVIHGVGGVGKTRLMLELGNIALDKGIQVIRVTRQKASLSELVASLERTGNYVILFDYIEESETYFIQELQQIQQDGLRLFPIANCRESYLPSNRIDHNPKNTYFIQFEADAELEAQFEDFVVQTILEGIQGFDFDQSLFQLRPAFAVFLYYLNATAKINAQDLADFADFNSWVARRLSLSLQKESINKIPRKVFHFMACLPAPNTQIQSFRADTELDLAFVNLEKDGWIDTELDGEGFATIVHDVLKDEALLQFHHYNGSKIARELEDSLVFALAHNAFPSWAWSYERIVGRGGVTNDISGAVIAKQLAANSAAFAGHDWILAATGLLSQAEKFKLIAAEADFFEDYTASWSFGYVLSHEIKRLHKASPEAAFPEMEGMLARWMAAHPTFYGNPKLSSYVLCAWLEAKADPSIVQEFVLAYIRQHAASPEARFVISSWLDSKADPNTIQEFVLAYLKQHAASPEASFVYKAWLDAKADPSSIKNFVLAYLKQHAASPEASFVYPAWLDATADSSTVKEFVLAYLKQHAASPEAQFVYKAWLDAKADPSKIKEFVLAYLKQHAATPEARFVFQAWLEATGDPSLIAMYVNSYLESHGYSMQAGFVWSAWLKAGGSMAGLEPIFEEYLDGNAQTQNAGHEFASFLSAGHPASEIEGYILDYLVAYPTEKKSGIIMGHWLMQGMPKQAIATAYRKWMDLWGQETFSEKLKQLWETGA